MFKLRTFVAFGAGLAAAYFLDPQQGPKRRNEALRRIQGDVAPQAKAQITSLQEAGKEVVQRANPRKAAEVTSPSPAPGAPPPMTEG